jgi:hypothetical protein
MVEGVGGGAAGLTVRQRIGWSIRRAGDAAMTVEIIITAEPLDPAQPPDPQGRDAAAAATPGATRAGPLSGLERAAFFAALRRKADARLAALG